MTKNYEGVFLLKKKTVVEEKTSYQKQMDDISKAGAHIDPEILKAADKRKKEEMQKKILHEAKLTIKGVNASLKETGSFTQTLGNAYKNTDRNEMTEILWTESP